ncbi:rod shape-determining protein MreC [Paenibacillus physcomitrellae]|uniref:Cell shape-determining protein MreC n=1 Tax=Paenibacillus physcomitrellae TaxID=1619311 RepID=A0ABQ1G5I6_9BACL|nr:rod shape-determining protein MreC [Paenibacillus physcomitrellae]GGA36566.1 cell shape-determining protein MreC [Paenibacillus physcomitrellae]
MLKLFKLLGNKRLFFLLMGLILFIAVMGFTLGPRAGLSWPEKFSKDTVGFVQYIVYKPVSYIAGFFEDISNLRSVQKENEELKIALAHYTRDKAKYNTIEQENERLRRDLKFTEQQELRNKNYEYRIAHVISVNNDPDNRTLVIDLGSRNGITKEMAVTSDKGLVGTVSQVSNFTATVKLMTTLDSKDPNSNAIAATVQGNENKSFGMIESYDQQKGMFLMTKIKSDDPLKKGDTIISSGLGGEFPRFMVIGTVESRQPGEFGLTDTAYIKPATEFSDWNELFVVVTPEVPQ